MENTLYKTPVRDHKNLRPQDIFVLFRLLSPAARHYRQIDLGFELGLSTTEIGHSIRRLMKSKLISSDRKPLQQPTIEFLLYGVKYFYPIEAGAISRGVPTAQSAPPINKNFRSRKIEDNYVWPTPDGVSMGQAISPLYPSASQLQKSCPPVYELLTLLDTIRLGTPELMDMAEQELILRIDGALRSVGGEKPHTTIPMPL